MNGYLWKEYGTAFRLQIPSVYKKDIKLWEGDGWRVVAKTVIGKPSTILKTNFEGGVESAKNYCSKNRLKYIRG